MDVLMCMMLLLVQLMGELMALKARRLAAANIINPRLQAGFRRKLAIRFAAHKRRSFMAAALLVQRVLRGRAARIAWAIRLACMQAAAR